LSGFWLYLYDYLSLGAGQFVMNFILRHSQPFSGRVDVGLSVLTLAGILFKLVRATPGSVLLRCAWTMLLAYAGSALAIYLLP